MPSGDAGRLPSGADRQYAHICSEGAGAFDVIQGRYGGEYEYIVLFDTEERGCASS